MFGAFRSLLSSLSWTLIPAEWWRCSALPAQHCSGDFTPTIEKKASFWTAEDLKSKEDLWLQVTGVSKHPCSLSGRWSRSCLHFFLHCSGMEDNSAWVQRSGSGSSSLRSAACTPCCSLQAELWPRFEPLRSFCRLHLSHSISGRGRV